MVANCSVKAANYLDLLSSEALWNIVRYMSSFPRCRDWAAFTSVENVRSLCRGTSALSTVFRERVRNAIVFRKEDELNGPLHIFADCPGGNFKLNYEDLTYILTPSSSDNSGEGSLTLISRITELELSEADHISELIRLTSATLISLRLDLPRYVGLRAWMSLLDHTNGLRSLSLRGFVTSLPLARLWAVVGESLESLEANLANNNVIIFLDELRENCRNLRHINLNWIECEVDSEIYLDDCIPAFEALTCLYLSYGAQLESLTIDVLPESYCSKIRQCCPNAKVRLVVLEDDDVAQMRALGPLVSILEFGPCDSDDPAFSEVWESQITAADCQNLQKIYASCLGLEDACNMLRHFLFPARGSLEKLCCTTWEGSDIMRIVAANCTSLKSFAVWTSAPDGGAFVNLVAANKGLQNVLIVVEDYGEDDHHINWETAATSIIAVFKPCAALRSLSLQISQFYRHCFPSFSAEQRSEVIANACSPFRFSETHVDIWGIAYIP